MSNFKVGQIVEVRPVHQIMETVSNERNHKKIGLYYPQGMERYSGGRYAISYTIDNDRLSLKGVSDYTWSFDWIKSISPLEEAEEL